MLQRFAFERKSISPINVGNVRLFKYAVTVWLKGRYTSLRGRNAEP